MKRKAKLYGPVLLAALLCALVFATGALKKPKIFENITTDYMAFQKKLPRYSLADGDEYGVIPMGRRGWMHLPAGEYRLRWVISCDGDNILRLTNTNDATITPSEFTIPAGAGDGELHFTVEEDCEDFKIEFEFAAGTYMDIYQVKLYTPEYQDDAFTLLFFAVGASILWLMIGTGRLTRENMAPVLFIALAVLIGSAPALKTTFVIGHDGTYHMARLLNLADGLKNGQFPVRMGGFAYDGYGGVMSVFYPDTFLYPFALMILGGASAVYVCNVFSVALNIGAALSMYAAAKRLFEKRWAATGASILYTLASYRVVNVFTRVAFGEALAMVFLPLFLVNLYDVVCGDARRWKGLALSAACIFCSHMITTLLCAVLAAGFCLLHIRKIILQKRLLPLVKAVLVCLLLCLYRIGPLVMYSMQGLGADDLFRNITEFSVELGQVLMMNAGTITRETNNPQIMEFSVEIGLPLMIGAALALYAALQKEERGKSEWAALKLVAGGALMTIAATDFFPWGAVSLLTQGQVGYIQFTWRLLILATPMLALAGGYGLCEFGGKRQDAAVVAALSMAVICVMPIFSSEIQNPIYVEKGVIISPFMGRSFPEYTYSDTTDFLAIRKRSVEIIGDAEMADYEKRSTTITAQVSARTESRITFPLFDYDGFRATVDGREIAVERGSNNRVSVVLPAGTSGALKIWFAGKGWWRVGDAVSAAALIGLLFWMKKGEKKACRTH